VLNLIYPASGFGGRSASLPAGMSIALVPVNLTMALASAAVFADRYKLPL
jgi:hypothetical protein